MGDTSDSFEEWADFAMRQEAEAVDMLFRHVCTRFVHSQHRIDARSVCAHQVERYAEGTAILPQSPLLCHAIWTLATAQQREKLGQAMVQRAQEAARASSDLLEAVFRPGLSGNPRFHYI